MKELTAREKVLKNVRNALLHKSTAQNSHIDYDTLVYKPITDLSEIYFAQQFTNNGGTFIYCENKKEAIDNFEYICEENNWKKIISSAAEIKSSILDQADVQVCNCQALIARTGTIALYAGNMAQLYCNNLVIFAYTNQLLNEIAELFTLQKDEKSFLNLSYTNFITSPTKDITGLYLFLIDG